MLLGPGGAGMTSDSDDLEEQLRQNLKLRRELAAEVAKAKGSSANQGGKKGGERYRLWVLALTLIGVLVGVIGVMAVHGFK